MAYRGSNSIDPMVLDSALADVSYSPEEVSLLERVLADVCGRAGTSVTLNDGLRSLLASAILEGALLGYRDHERLASFALRALPTFREARADS